MSSHHMLMAGLAIEQGDRAGAMRHLELARNARRSNRLDALIVSRLNAERRYDDARSYIEEAESELPLHPLRRLSTTLALQRLRREVDALQMQAINSSESRGISDSG